MPLPKKGSDIPGPSFTYKEKAADASGAGVGAGDQKR